MTYLKLTAYAAFVLSVIVLIVAIANEAVLLIGGSIWAALIGIAMLAASEAIGYLREMRDALVGARSDIDTASAQDRGAQSTDTAPELRSITEISNDLERIKTRM
ncbi:hypothetical protein TG4357_03356 [Thalassovita gelatinovora]|uniref:Uncharacterized protein n=1 Tax=Thalassovita gelatinovora TaxID=53501 RepID=A0A0P1FJ88_THAGE|nr:hypothetical protein [Thalassovita gelatinovora]QIZ81596.1 hypothetical protein HFZ77_14470 [Thalassovita gelatinovora]CUH68039.1 hypothetical protein TG4357_03356 [Thalassovita gelatinovora]SEQ28068.1 hypothetical protein SAMN04488043_104227 [Thalassovita gelatinovora]